MKYLLYFIIMLSILSCRINKTQSQQNNNEDFNTDYNENIKKTGHKQVFDKDLVNDEQIAIKLANIYLDARYGDLKIVRDMPYTVILENNKVWYIKTNLPKGYKGRVLHIKISKYDGQILYMWSEG